MVVNRWLLPLTIDGAEASAVDILCHNEVPWMSIDIGGATAIDIVRTFDKKRLSTDGYSRPQ